MTPSLPSPTEPSTRAIFAAEIVAAFAAGRSFIENPEYRIAVARRDGPGDAEVHDVDTDIFYVFEGAATVVTGGQMVEPRTVGSNEHRAPRVTGGESRKLTKGDIIVIPRTVPHWFNEVVEAPFVYLVVKVTAR